MRETGAEWAAWASTVVLVEGDSDAAAVHALATKLGRDLRRESVHVLSANGVTNYTRLLHDITTALPAAAIVGLYDAAEEHHVRRGLNRLGAGDVRSRIDIETRHFFVCDTDLEDEMIRALGPDAVQHVLAEQDELVSFRRFQAMPQHRESTVEAQLHRFLGTRATRKVRYGRLLVDALDLDRAPTPLLRLLACAGEGRGTVAT